MTTLHEAIAIGIDRGLTDLGGDLSNCTPSMLAHSVINALRNAGPDLFANPVASTADNGEIVRLPVNWREQLHKVEHGAMDARATAKTVALIESWIGAHRGE